MLRHCLKLQSAHVAVHRRFYVSNVFSPTGHTLHGYGGKDAACVERAGGHLIHSMACVCFNIIVKCICRHIHTNRKCGKWFADKQKKAWLIYTVSHQHAHSVAVSRQRCSPFRYACHWTINDTHPKAQDKIWMISVSTYLDICIQT